MDYKKSQSNALYKLLTWTLISLGIILRLIEYFSNKSLWRDEAMLALNLSERSYSQLLFETLNYNQYAPPGFLVIEKSIIDFLGNTEFTLRVFPLICSIASIFVFYKLCSKLLSKEALLIALGMFSISTALLYYSAETKQYSSDVLITLILILICIEILLKDLSIQKTLLFGLICSLLIWFSHSSIIVLCGCVIYLTLESFLEKDFKKLSFLLLFSSLWIVSFLIFYRVALIHTSENQGLASLWEYYFLPFPSLKDHSIAIYKNLFRELLRFFTLGMPAILCLSIGFYRFYKNQYKYFFILVSPIAVTLLLSISHKYPLFERFILFLLPSLIIFISEGAERIRQSVWKVSPLFGIIILSLLFYKPCYFTINDFLHPATQEEVKPVFKYLKEHLKDNDIIFISEPLQYSFKYYSKRYNFCNNFSIVPERNLLEEVKCPESSHKLYLGSSELIKDSIKKDFSSCIGSKRVWVLLSEKRLIDLQYKSSVTNYLNGIGVKTGSFLRTGVILYLYDLKPINQQISFLG